MKWFKKNIQVEFWDDLETMPVFHWIKMHQTGDMNHLIISGNPTFEEIRQAWHNLNNQYLKKYGLTDQVRRVLSLRKRYAAALAKYISTNDKKDEMECDILEVEINSLNEDNDKPVDFSAITVSIERFFRFQIDLNKTSVDKYCSYIKDMNEAKKKLKNQANV